MQKSWELAGSNDQSTKKVKRSFCARKTFLNSFLFQTVRVRLNLKKCSLSKTFGDVWGLEHICKHSWQPRRARWEKKKQKKHQLEPSIPDFSLIDLLTGSLGCVESPAEVRRAGSVLEVRGQTKAGHCVLTHMSRVPTVGHGFLSPHLSRFWLFRGTKRTETLFGVSGLCNVRAERKGGHSEDFGMQSSHRWACRAEGGECKC